MNATDTSRGSNRNDKHTWKSEAKIGCLWAIPVCPLFQGLWADHKDYTSRNTNQEYPEQDSLVDA